MTLSDSGLGLDFFFGKEQRGEVVLTLANIFESGFFLRKGQGTQHLLCL